MSLKNWGNYEDYDDLASSFEEDLAGDAAFWKPVVGENEIRLLPLPGQKRPYIMRAQHWVRKGNNRTPFNCPNFEDEGVKCFLCGEAAALAGADNKEDKEAGKQLKAKPQWLFAILDMEHPKKGPQVYAAPKTVVQDIATILTDKKDYGPIVLSPTEGFNLVLTREGTSQNDTEYSVRARRNPEDISEFIEKADPPDIAALCAVSSNEEMQEAWEDEGEEEPKTRRREVSDDEPRSRRRDADDDEPKARRSAEDDDPPARRRSADDDEPPARRRQTVDDDEPKPARPGRRLRND